MRTPEPPEAGHEEPIAVVGIGLRFPGGNETLSGFDEFLRAGASGIRPLPRDRWDVDAFAPGGAETRGAIRTTAGGFLDRIDEFDPQFFNLSPKQAQYVDPQQRLLLETAWEALESAGIDATLIRDGGVYVGATPFDQAMELDSVPYEKLDGALATGMGAYPLSGRLSYFLRWHGPSLTTDTACASSLTALHMAVAGLRNKECGIALCGGVNALHHPRIFAILSEGQMLAPDGRCKTFDEAADGYARAEGCGVIVLKRLSDARRDGDTVLALVRSTAIGHNGESAGLTAPNGTSQEVVMRQALARARLQPGDIQYVEAHGTGTPLGDPIEMASINGVFGSAHQEGEPLTVGSVKSNLGHMEPVAGLGGIIKVILQMREGVFYPHLYKTPSGRIPWDRYPVTVPTECGPWKAPVRRAIVNSFGVAGAIGIAVLEEAPEQPVEEESSEGPHVLTLSAKSLSALGLQIERYRRFLLERPTTVVADLCRTRNTGRSHFKHRVSGVVHDHAEAVALLDRTAAQLAAGERTSGDLRKVAFLFTGSGSQYAGMGATLYRRFSVFREHVDACDSYFAGHLDRSARDIMLGAAEDAEERLTETVYAHAALFTLEYALAKLWQSWGIRPQVLVGHSVGEIAAATVAGLFTLADGIRFVAARASLIQSVAAPGGMAAVSAPADEVEPLLEAWPDLDIAAVNGPMQCVVSGGDESLAQFTEELRTRGMKVSALRVSSAFHSPLMDGILDPLRATLNKIEFREPSLTLVSCLTGGVADPRELATAEYWVRHVRETVNFEGGIRTVAGRGDHVFVEMGPSSALGSLARRCISDGKHRWVTSLRPSDPQGRAVHQALADAYAAGLSVSWVAVHQEGPGRRIPLPSYAFDRKRYWLPDQVGRHSRGVARTVSSLLGTETRSPAIGDGDTREFVTRLGARTVPYVADHTLHGRPFVPAGAYTEMILGVMDAVYGDTWRPIENVRFHEALFLGDEPVEVRTRWMPQADGRAAVEIVSLSAGVPDSIERRHVTALIDARAEGGPGLSNIGRELCEQAVVPGEPAGGLDGQGVHAAYAATGLDYGPQFSRVIGVVRYGTNFTLSEIDGSDVSLSEHMPPQLFDAATQSLAALVDRDHRYIATGTSTVRALKKPRASRLRAALCVRLPDDDSPGFTADAVLLEGDIPVLEITGMAFIRLDVTAPAGDSVDPAVSRPARSRTTTSTESLVRAAVARLLRLEDAEAIESDTEFLDLGMDSLTATELRRHLEEELSMALPESIVFDHPCIRQLVNFLQEQSVKDGM